MKKKFLKIFIIIFFGALTVSGLPGLQGKKLSQDINNLYQRIFNRMPPSDKNKVLLAVKNYEQRITPADGDHDYYLLAERSIQNFLPAGLSNMDVSEAAFLVMMMATKDMDDDIRMIMKEIKAMTAAKQKLREIITELNKWISENMNNLPDSEDIDLDKVSGGRKDAKKESRLSRTIMYPKMEITPNYKVKYYKTPITKPNPNLRRMSLNELKMRLQQSNEELKILIKVDEATRLALRPLSEKRNKLIQVIKNLYRKKYRIIDKIA